MRAHRVPVVLLPPLLIATLPGAALHAQEGAQATPRPEQWMLRGDRAEADLAEIFFADMPPGWHITSGPAAIYWHPETTASGEFAVEMESHLFDPRGRREAFGFFMGGRDLEGDGQRYVYFLLREGDEFLVKRRSGEATEVLVDWSPAPSMVSFAEAGPDATTAKNVLRVEAGREQVRFLVNGEEVGKMPRVDLDLDGIVGFRINHGLNLHVTRLEVAPGG